MRGMETGQMRRLCTSNSFLICAVLCGFNFLISENM